MKKNHWINKIILSITVGTVLFFCSNGNTAQAKPGDAYSADKAVTYADSCFKKKGGSYRKNPSKKYGEELCAGYVSQCLKEGGMATDKTWNWKGIGKTTDAWRISKKLYSYLKKCGYKITYSPSGSDVKKGDVVFYWTNGGWGHVAICVGKTKSGKPMVNAYNDPHYHFSYWTMGYKTCVVSMESTTTTPTIEETLVKNGKSVSIDCAMKNANIYYTTNGTTPTKSSKKYTGSFTLKKPATVKAMAVYSSYKKSKTASSYIDPYKTISDGVYHLRTTAGNKMALGVTNSSKKEKASLSLMKTSAQYNRKFMVKYKGNGNYTFTLLHTGYALTETLEKKGTLSANVLHKDTVLKAAKKSNTKTKIGIVNQKKATKDTSQQWKIHYKKKGTYEIKNKKSKDYLSIGSGFKAGVSAYTTSKAEKYGQTWNLTSTTRSQLKLLKCSAPGTINPNNSYRLNGTIQSNYTIENVKASILNSKGKTVRFCSASPKKNTYSLNNLSLSTKNLKEGIYTFRLTAYDSSKMTKTLFTKKFMIKKK